MKPKLYIISVLLLCAITYAQKQPHCGRFMDENDVAELETLVADDYDYPGDDMDLLADITTAIIDMYNEKEEFEVFFLMNDGQNITIEIVGQFKKGMVDEIACYILKSNLKGLPKVRWLLFLDEPTNNVVALIKSR